MGVNKSTDGPENELINRLTTLERIVADMRNNPQPLGNGSINYAIFSPPIEWSSGITVAAGASVQFTALFMADSSPLTYNSLPAISRLTLFELVFSVYVDSYDFAHVFPYGSSLTAAQRSARASSWCDYELTSLSETAGQRYVVIQVANTDTVSHTYYCKATALIPRPALKRM